MVNQLTEFEKFTEEEAKYAVENAGIDWKKKLKKAKVIKKTAVIKWSIKKSVNRIWKIYNEASMRRTFRIKKAGLKVGFQKLDRKNLTLGVLYEIKLWR